MVGTGGFWVEAVLAVSLKSSEPENKLPDCVLLKLHGCEVMSQGKDAGTALVLPAKPVAGGNCVDLKLTIRFGEAELQVLGGTVRFGLRRGILRLQIENGKIPVETTADLVSLLPTRLEVAAQTETGSETEGTTAVSVTGGVTARTKGTAKTSTGVKYSTCQIDGGGTEAAPTWTFEVKTDQPILKGLLPEGYLGQLQVAGKPCRVEAVFVVSSQQDIGLTKALWSENISRNKRAVLERKLFLSQILPRLQPHLSRVEVHYE